MKILADDNIVAYIFRTYEREAKIIKIGKDDEYVEFLRDFYNDARVVDFSEFLHNGINDKIDGIISIFDFSNAKFNIDELGEALMFVANKLKSNVKFFICVKNQNDTAVQENKASAFKQDELRQIGTKIGKVQIEHVRLSFYGRKIINDYHIMIIEYKKD